MLTKEIIVAITRETLEEMGYSGYFWIFGDYNNNSEKIDSDVNIAFDIFGFDNVKNAEKINLELKKRLKTRRVIVTNTAFLKFKDKTEDQIRLEKELKKGTVFCI